MTRRAIAADRPATPRFQSRMPSSTPAGFRLPDVLPQITQTKTGRPAGSGMEMQETPDCVLDLRCPLGEGPVWRAGALWFVDIKQKRIHRLDPASGAHDHWDAPS